MVNEKKSTVFKLSEEVEPTFTPVAEETLPKRKPRQKKAKPHPLEGKVVRGSGPAYWLIERGKRRLIPSVQVFYRLGLQVVLRLPDEELEAIKQGKDWG